MILNKFYIHIHLDEMCFYVGLSLFSWDMTHCTIHTDSIFPDEFFAYDILDVELIGYICYIFDGIFLHEWQQYGCSKFQVFQMI